MGLHLLSFVGFVISGVFGVWLVWGIARSGRCRLVTGLTCLLGQAPVVPQAAASTGSCGSARTIRPSRPVVSIAAQSALSTASSVASTVAAKSVVEMRVRNRLPRDPEWWTVVPLGRGGREREEDLAAPVVGDRAGAGETETGAAGEPLELRGFQRRVGRDDRDAAAGRWPRVETVADRREDRDAVDAEVAGRAEVREHEHADRRVDLGDEAARRSDAALPAERDHARARPDTALLDRAVACRGDRSGSVLGLDLHGAGVVQPAVVAFADDRDHDVVDAHAAVGRTGERDGTVEDTPDGHRRGQKHRASRSGPTRRSGETRSARRRRSAPPTPAGTGLRNRDAWAAGHDRRHTRPRDPAAVRRRRLVADDGDVPDADAGDVGDRIRGAGLQMADAESVPRAASSRPSRTTL